jgi:DNA ligase (NAD+)
VILAPRQQWENILTERGANITGSVSKNTDTVLAGSGTENGSKLSKAKELGISIVSERELAEMIEEARTHSFETIRFF